MKFALVLLLVFSINISILSAKQTVTPVVLPIVKINQIDNAEMVEIPAGDFLMGSRDEDIIKWVLNHPGDKKEWYNNELPQRKIYLNSYFIYKKEVTVAQYRKFCTVTKRVMPEEPEWKWKDSDPIVNVSWEDANAYAIWAGVALPTEAQWEKAAHGSSSLTFPWGNNWPPLKKTGNFADKKAKNKYPALITIDGYDDGFANTASSGSFAPNQYGIYNLSDNVSEWCFDWYKEDYYKDAPEKKSKWSGYWEYEGYKRWFVEYRICRSSSLGIS